MEEDGDKNVTTTHFPNEPGTNKVQIEAEAAPVNKYLIYEKRNFANSIPCDKRSIDGELEGEHDAYHSPKKIPCIKHFPREQDFSGKSVDSGAKCYTYLAAENNFLADARENYSFLPIEKQTREISPKTGYGSNDNVVNNERVAKAKPNSNSENTFENPPVDDENYSKMLFKCHNSPLQKPLHAYGNSETSQPPSSSHENVQVLESFMMNMMEQPSSTATSSTSDKVVLGMHNTNIMSTPQSLTMPSVGSHLVHTPHPRHGQLVYLTQLSDGPPHLVQKFLPADSKIDFHINPQFATPKSQVKNVEANNIGLNSSGEENCSPTDYPSCPITPFNTPVDVQEKKQQFSFKCSPEDDPSRQQHNLKERKRRARIKVACDLMRKLVPGLSEKTDKATVFEFAARYIHFLRGFVDNQYDKDFLIKYSPY